MKFIIDNWMLITVALASGGMLLWPTLAGAATPGALAPSAVVNLINREKAVVVDVCSADEFKQGHVGDAINIPLDQLEQKLPGAVKDKSTPVVLVCQVGARSGRAVGIAKKLGYEKAQSMAGGLKAWKDANLLVVKS